VWMGGALVSQLGDSMMFFALGWAASRYGGLEAGAVLAAVALPRALLMLIGGSLTDRFRPYRVAMAGYVSMVCLMIAVVAILAVAEPSWAVLVVFAVLLGVVDALFTPATSSMPRYIVGRSALDKALAAKQSGGQIVSLTAGPIGGFAVGSWGLGGVSLINAASFLLLIAITYVAVGAIDRSHRDEPQATPDEESLGLIAEGLAGLRFCLADPSMRAMLALLTAVSGFVVPIASLVLPLVARENDWGPQIAGLVLGAQAVGSLGVSLYVARNGALSRPGLTAAASTLPIAMGAAVLGLSSSPAVAVVAGAGLGVGLALFVTHIAPLILATAPFDMMGRVQAVSTLVQSVSLLVTLPVLGVIADAVHPQLVAIVCATAILTAGALAALTSTVRGATFQPANAEVKGEEATIE
jgi:MFS family permease